MVTKADQLDRQAVERHVWEALARVHDPEIPPCSITDLGIVERVAVTEDAVEVDLLPTFAGCPALDVIEEDARAAVTAAAGSARRVELRFVYSPPWTSDRISAEGREQLRRYGVTPPHHGSAPVFIPLAALDGPEGTAVCPFCRSQDTVLESAFGPTLCRSTHFCRACRNPFEAFKPKAKPPW